MYVYMYSFICVSQPEFFFSDFAFQEFEDGGENSSLLRMSFLFTTCALNI